MGEFTDSQDFENPWRPVHEWKMAIGWFMASTMTILVSKTLPIPVKFGVSVTLLTAAIGLYRAIQAKQRSQDSNRLMDSGRQFITIPEIIAIGKKSRDKQAIWLGKGFHWTDIEASRMHNLINNGIAKRFGKKVLHKEGAYWLHGLAKEEDAYNDLANLVGHTLITGTTRVGKAQPLDALVRITGGWKTMGEMRVGDIVSTPDGKSAKILHIFPQGILQIYRLTLNDGSSAEGCAAHFWEVRCDETIEISTTYELFLRLRQGHRLEIRKLNFGESEHPTTTWLEIVSIQHVRDAEAQCLYIDHHDHLYITNDGIVTHNTRLFDLLIAQAIIRDEPVIIIDPKGDHGLAENARLICQALGQPDRFVYFNPAHPEKSACIDPLRNWNSKTELASRVAALIPSETGADPFTAFGWKVINDIVNGLIATGQRPNLAKLRRYIEGGPDDLLLKALRQHFKLHVPDWESRIAGFIKQLKDHLLAYIAFYKQVVIHDSPAPELEGLISSFEHNRDHFQKMVASLIPILSMLTSGPLGDLLSPDFEPGHERQITDMASVIRKSKVLYIGLNSLPDGTVGSAIGSVLLADATAVAGDRYNYDVASTHPINLFVDEAAEVINVPTIQLMNKAGGAGFRVTIATQTFADFAVRLGSPDKARQVLANTNNKITLRVLDSETQQYIADGIPKIKVDSMAVSYGHSVDADINDTYTAQYKEQATKEEADLIPPAILSELPPLHYFARLSGGRTIKGRLPILIP